MKKQNGPIFNKHPDIWEIEGVMISFPEEDKNNCVNYKYDLPFIQPSRQLSVYKKKYKNKRQRPESGWTYTSDIAIIFLKFENSVMKDCLRAGVLGYSIFFRKMSLFY